MLTVLWQRLLDKCMLIPIFHKTTTSRIWESPQVNVLVSLYSAKQMHITLKQLDHKLQCCTNTESHCARVTGSVKWRVMTPVQRRGLVEMTLKHGATHSAPVKCLKTAFSTSSQPAGEWLTLLLTALPASIHSVWVTSPPRRYISLWIKIYVVWAETSCFVSWCMERIISYFRK